MMYLWPQSSSLVDKSELFGVFTSPAHGAVPLGIQEGRPWACDNGAFTGFDAPKYIKHLARLRKYHGTCLFVSAPDVVGDADATLDLYTRWYPLLKADDWLVAFVAQDGQENLPMPEFDWLFIGGGTKWKLGDGAKACITRAHIRNKPVHIGRVNSWKRYQYFKGLGAQTCDGTHPIYEPDAAVIRITDWMERPINLPLFGSNHLGELVSSQVWSTGDGD